MTESIKLDTALLGLALGVIDAKIVGIGTTFQPVLGRMLILHAPAVKSDDYPYEYINCPESLISRDNPDD